MTNMNPMFPWAEQLKEAMLRGGVDIGGMPVNDAMQVVVGRIATLTEQLEAARRDAGEASTKWQPIETAPRDGTRIIATGDGFGYEMPTCCAVIWDDGWQVDQWESLGEIPEPTHWMPLPEAPKESPQCP